MSTTSFVAIILELGNAGRYRTVSHGRCSILGRRYSVKEKKVNFVFKFSVSTPLILCV